jgi:hypothetical protein
MITISLYFFLLYDVEDTRIDMIGKHSLTQPLSRVHMKHRGHLIWSDFDRSLEKLSPAARRILAALSAATQMRSKFGHGLRRRELTALSARAPYSPTRARRPVAPRPRSKSGMCCM